MGRDSSVSGSVGTVCLTFSPADENGNSQQCFRIHGGNNIEKLGLNVVANPYSGKWMGNESGCWSIQTANSLGSGKAVGSWVSVRTGGTAKGKVNMSKSFNVGGSSEQSVSTEVRNAISSTVELGVEFIPGGSGSVSVTGSRETANTEASSIAKTFDNGDAISCEQDVDTETYDYEVMWQWQIHTTTGATQATIATCTVACTSTGATPTFPPGSPQQLASCKIRR